MTLPQLQQRFLESGTNEDALRLVLGYIYHRDLDEFLRFRAEEILEIPVATEP